MLLAFHDDHPSFAAAHWRNGVIVVWTGKVTAEALDRLHMFQAARPRSYERYYIVTVNPTGLPFPDSQARSVARELIRKRDHEPLDVITVLEGDGLFASAGRVVLSALFSRANAKDVICQDMTEAARALTSRVLPAADERAARMALEVVRGEARKRRRVDTSGVASHPPS